jgi:uncharacterized NAD(P)/FAD-binding protein YdhS
VSLYNLQPAFHAHPLSTVTTSDSTTTTTTSVTRLISTETVTSTATKTLAPVKARAANIAAVAEDMFNAVVNSGVPASAVSTDDNAQRSQAASGLANACSCKLVDPTSTVTESYALPPAVSSERFCIGAETDLTVHYRGLPCHRRVRNDRDEEIHRHDDRHPDCRS